MQNPLATYEAAIAALKDADDTAALGFKHQAVLALSRAGSLEFALSEYARYGLGEICHHEDIMGLGGRLYKDLYLSHQGAQAREYARLSAEQYEDAFRDTGGYYSGINAATMSRLGGMPKEVVDMQARKILEILSIEDEVSDEEIYFIEATRAEAYLLLGDIERAQAALRRALDYDPLNYIAHASTLKQFRMLGRAEGKDLPWLSEFDPPRAMHFAGHIFGREGDAKDFSVLTPEQEDQLFSEASNIIQENDIGIGYGALAAGADILIAEALLEEGGELHVILPIDEKKFVEASVKPFGKQWMRRFSACLKQASTISVFDYFSDWPDTLLRERASLIAMGGAIRNSEELSVSACQLLIWEGKKGTAGTAKDAQTWQKSGRKQFIIDYKWPRNAKPHPKPKPGYKFRAAVFRSDGEEPIIYDDLLEAIVAATAARTEQPNIAQSVDYDLTHAEDLGSLLINDIGDALPGAIHMSELSANYLSVYHSDDYRVDYIGLSPDGTRVFTLRERG
ncbi:MAG: DUF4071 domain-containing protein [Hellea sp.]|nr:DUF4071 domain-containing protein [Hellea sp.]